MKDIRPPQFQKNSQENPASQQGRIINARNQDSKTSPATRGTAAKKRFSQIKIPKVSKRRLNMTMRSITSGRFIRRIWAFTKKHHRIIIIVIILIITHGLVYRWGNSNGYTAGVKKATTSQQEDASRKIIEKKSIPYRSLSGSITALQDDKLTIRTPDGKEVTFTTTDKTKYSQKGVSKTRADLRVGNQVTVFATDTDNLKATNVVIVK